jgi:lysozyme family protein
MDRFAEVLPVTLVHEGGFSNHPKDPGGATMKGVTQRVYDGYRDGRRQPRQSVRYISNAELVEIYRFNYWNMVRGDELPAGVDLAVFDFGVNSGPGTAIKHLQKVLGIRQDAHPGAVTIAEASRRDPAVLVQSYMAARRAYLRSLSTFPVFGTGWMRRCDAVERSALAAIGHAGPSVVAMGPSVLPDADAQSESQGRAYAEAPRPPAGTELTLASGGGTSMAYAAPNVIARATAGGSFSIRLFVLALLSEPLFWAGMVTLWGAIAVWIYRRRHAA